MNGKYKMDALIRNLESIPISLEGIKRIGLPRNVAAVLYQNLDSTHLKKDAVIILLEDKKQRIGHFITIVNGKEYFDSYGKSPEFALKKTNSSDKLLRLLPKNYVRNRARLQRETGSIETCGLFCIARALFNHLTQKEFLGLFRKKTHLNNADETITLMTLLIRKLMESK